MAQGLGQAIGSRTAQPTERSRTRGGIGVALGRAASGAPAIHHDMTFSDESPDELHGVRSSIRNLVMQASPASGDQGLVMRLIESAGAAIFGALVSLVAFRTRLAVMDRDIAQVQAELKEQRADTERRHKENIEAAGANARESNRKQAMLLEIVASIARKVGADARFSDALVRFLTEEDGNEHS